MDAAHADAVARARAIAARLAGVPAAADLGGGTTAASTAAAPAAPQPTANGNAPVVAADVQAMLDAALGGGGGAAATTTSSTAAVPAVTAAASTTAASSKRGVEDALASLIPGLGHSDSNKRARTDGGAGTSSSSNAADGSGRVTKKIWIPSDKNPGYNYVGLLIGPGGSKQRELVAKSGGQVKISIRGKGSTQKMDSIPGMPDEPLHVLLEGTQECVDKAEVLVRELLENSEAADAEKARQLGSLNEGGAGGGGGDKPAATSSYTPKPVAQILGQMAGSTPLSAYGAAPEQQVEEKIGIPNGVVGFIIGRGGESITSMQRRTGCRVQIQKEHEMAPGTAQRVITLTAPTAESIAQCRGIIEEMVKERLAATASTSSSSTGLGGVGGGMSLGGPGSNATAQMAQLQKALAEGQVHVTVQVPDADVGLIIGKGGAQIRTIQENSGANVQIPQVADANDPTVRTVNITHPNKEGAEFAKQMIQEILNAKLQNQSGGGGGGGMGSGDATIQVNVSLFACVVFFLY
jgi:far upstream element-binding protein